ncbi:MAG: hypothetical protein P8170_24370 [Gemmatimonadota bacterium]
MMSGGCGNREERLITLLYEDGDPSDLAEIRAHLAACAPCREELEELASTRELLAAWPNVDNAPRMVFVNELVGSARRSGGGPARSGRGGLRAFLPSRAAAAAVVLLVATSALFLPFQVGADGRLRVGLGASSADGFAFVTRQDLDLGLARTAEYLETMVRAAREEDRQAVLEAVDQALWDQNASMGNQVATAINSAFDEADRRRRTDLGVMLSSMNDLQVITRTEIQQLNAMLASLAQALPSADQE